MRYLITVIVSLVFVVGHATAATPEDVQRIAQAMMHKEDARRLLSWTEYEGAVGEVQIVLVQNKTRYTIFYSGHTYQHSGKSIPADQQWISIWVRPDGTSDRKDGDAFTDADLDGEVDDGVLGLYPTTSGADDARKVFDNGAMKIRLNADDPIPQIGMQHQRYWQSRYDAAIRDILQFYGRK